MRTHAVERPCHALKTAATRTCVVSRDIGRREEQIGRAAARLPRAMRRERCLAHLSCGRVAAAQAETQTNEPPLHMPGTGEAGLDGAFL